MEYFGVRILDYSLSRLPLMLVLKSIKPLWIIVLTSIHMFTGQVSVFLEIFK